MAGQVWRFSTQVKRLVAYYPRYLIAGLTTPWTAWSYVVDSTPEVQKVVNPVILDDRKYIQNQGLAENISKT